MPLRSCRFVHTGGRVFFFCDSNGSIISHSLSVKSLEYLMNIPWILALPQLCRFYSIARCLSIARYPSIVRCLSSVKISQMGSLQKVPRYKIISLENPPTLDQFTIDSELDGHCVGPVLVKIKDIM